MTKCPFRVHMFLPRRIVEVETTYLEIISLTYKIKQEYMEAHIFPFFLLGKQWFVDL
jgi:hypothetical protein